jgi:8-oxo-dGTP pyrophosphatase MutT (NUDIX family)
MKTAAAINLIKQELQKPLPGISAQELMTGRVLPLPDEIPDTAKISAVLCLLFPVKDDIAVLLMKRMPDNTAHSGQVSFPGGKREKNDVDLKATALREANEEVGLKINTVEILGALTPLYIPVSNFKVHPFVGFSEQKPELNLNKREVERTIEVPLDYLFHHANKKEAEVIPPARPDMIRKVKAYILNDGTVVWGATAMILSELEVLTKGLRGEN